MGLSPVTALPPPTAVRRPPRLISSGEWQRRWRAEPDHNDVWISWLWLQPWLEVYGGERGLRILGWSDGSVCPLMVRRRWGPVRRIGFPGYDGRRRILNGTATAAEAAVWLTQQRDWDLSDLQDVTEEQAESWQRGLQEGGLRVQRNVARRQRYIPLRRSWAEIEREFADGLSRNLDRRERGLARAVPWRASVATAPADVAQTFEECLAVEASGWKGRRGTAMTRQPQVEAFYRKLAHRAAVGGHAYLARLHAGDRLIAFEFNLRCGGLLAGLKMGYDHEYRTFAPGMILLRWVLRNAHAQGLKEVDFSGGDEPYKAQWTPHTRTLVNLRAFNRTALGRLLSTACDLRCGMHEN